MPIYSTRPSQLLPFLNDLEEKINNMEPSVEEWQRNQQNVLKNIEKIGNIDFKAKAAMGQAGMALSEIGNATVNVRERMPKRLAKLIENLKLEMQTFLEENGGGSGAYDERINAEIDNAISSVDAVVEDGLKLDYRLEEIQDIAFQGKTFSEKEIYFPYMHHEIDPVTTKHIQVPETEGVVFQEGTVTVLDESLKPILKSDYSILTGTIDENGAITLPEAPQKPVKFYFPVTMEFQDIPSNFLFTLLQLTVDKASENMQNILNFEQELKEIKDILQKMQGLNWTEEFNIMRNHRNIIKESITPSGLDVEVKNGLAHATFSYSDHPYLSHFIMQKWDETNKKWVPYNGTDGIVTK